MKLLPYWCVLVRNPPDVNFYSRVLPMSTLRKPRDVDSHSEFHLLFSSTSLPFHIPPVWVHQSHPGFREGGKSHACAAWYYSDSSDHHHHHAAELSEVGDLARCSATTRCWAIIVDTRPMVKNATASSQLCLWNLASSQVLGFIFLHYLSDFSARS